MDEYRINIADVLQELNTCEASIFGLIIFRRLYPNYQVFNKMYEHPFSEERLWEIHNEFVQKIKQHKIEPHDPALLDKEIFELMPEPGDYDSILVSSALDASASLMALNTFLGEKNNKRIVGISSMAFDSIDMYIQEIENLPAKFDESIIDNHPLMLKEIAFQQDLIENIKKDGLKTLDTYQNLKGSLELDWMLTDTDEDVLDPEGTDQLTIKYPEGFAKISDYSSKLKDHFITRPDVIYGNYDQSVLIGLTFNKNQVNRQPLAEYLTTIKQEISQTRIVEWEPDEKRPISGHQSVLLRFYSGKGHERTFTLMYCIQYKEKFVILTSICKEVQTSNWIERFQRCLDSIQFG